MRRGPAPKPDDQRARRNKPELEWTDLGSSPVAKAPPLPGSSKFSVETRRWYRAWTRAPQASQFTLTDWLTLHMLAPLVDSYYADPTPAKLGEIRQGHAKLGATIDDRMKLRLRVQLRGQVEAESPASEPSPRRRPRSADPRLSLVKDKSA